MVTDTQRPPAEEVDTTETVARVLFGAVSVINSDTVDLAAAKAVTADRVALKQRRIGLYYDDEVAELRAKATALDQYLNWLDKKPAELPSDTCGEIAEELRTLITEHTTEEGK